MKKNSLLVGTSILVFGAVISKIVGAVYRIFLANIVGGEGIGMYQLIMSVYSFLVVLVTSGIPLAISKLIADCNANDKQSHKSKIIKLSMLFLAIISILLSIILILGAEKIAILQGNPEIKKSYFAIAPALFFVSMIAVYKGYFQGECIFTPTAISQIVEQVFKVGVGLAFALIFVESGILQAIFYAVIAISISEVITFIYLLFVYAKHKKKEQQNCCDEKSTKILQNVISTTLPITLAGLAIPLSMFVDSFLVINMLKANYSTEIATTMYGIQSGVVNSLINIPTILSFSLATAIMPNLTTNSKNVYECGQKLGVSSKIILLIVLPCVLGGAMFSREIIAAIYGNSLQVEGLDSLKLASELLAISSVSMLYIGFVQIFSISLQAFDKKYVTLKNIFVAIIIKIVFEIAFLSTNYLNIYALAIANVLCYMVAMLLDLFSLKKCVDFFVSGRDLLKIIFSTLFSMCIIYVLQLLAFGRFWIVVSVLVGVVAYVISLFVFNVFNEHEKHLLFNRKLK